MENPNEFNFSSESSEEPEAEESKDKKKRRRVRSFLESYLADNQKEEAGDDEEEEESSAPESLDTEEKKSIWDKLNESLINNVVEEPDELEQSAPEELTQDEEGNSEEIDQFAVNTGSTKTEVEWNEPEPSNDREHENTITESDFSVSNSESEDLLPQFTPEYESMDKSSALEPATETVYTRVPELEEDEPEDGVVLPNPDHISHETEGEEQVIDLIEPETTDAEPATRHDRGYGETATLDRPESVGKIVERVETRHGGALTSLIVGEYLSRGRDRKLRIEDARQETEINKLKDRLDTAEVSQKVLEKKQTEVAPRVERIEKVEQKRPPKTYENINLSTGPRVELNGGTEEVPIQPEVQDRSTASIDRQNVLITEKQIDEQLRARPENQPEAVLYQVKEAADKNIPIESLYEKRHEIRDSADVVYGAASGVNIDDLDTRATVGANTPMGINNKSQGYNQTPNGQLPGGVSGDKKPYSQAMAAGFWGAVAILLLLAALALVR